MPGRNIFCSTYFHVILLYSYFKRLVLKDNKQIEFTGGKNDLVGEYPSMKVKSFIIKKNLVKKIKKRM